MISLRGLPLPPSSNHAYITRQHRGRVWQAPSKELEQFKKNFSLWCAINPHIISRTRSIVVSPIQKPIRVDRYFVIHHQRLFTKQGKPKRLDASNRIKPLDDALADALGIDDTWFFSGTCEKVSCREVDQECSIIILSQMERPRTLLDILTSPSGELPS